MPTKTDETPKMNKRLRSSFEQQLTNDFRNGKVWPRRPESPTDQQILNDLKAGRYTVRKTLAVEKAYGLGQYFHIDCLDKWVKNGEKLAAQAERSNTDFNKAYYKAADDLARTESAVDAMKIIDTFRILAEKRKA